MRKIAGWGRNIDAECGHPFGVLDVIAPVKVF